MWVKLGRIAYWLAWPVWPIYFKIWDRRSRVLIFHDNKLLLVNLVVGDGSWHCAGGGAKLKESIEDSAVREVKEEVGITIKVQDLEPVATLKHKHHSYSFDAVFFVFHLNKKPSVKIGRGEIAEARWFTAEEVKRLKIDQDIPKALDKYKGGIWYNS